MNYRISYYDTTLLSLKKWRNQDGGCTETFATELEALRRARELIEEGEVHGVVLTDNSGMALGGIRLQLKLGFSAVE
jgi:hypothetical protein